MKATERIFVCDFETVVTGDKGQDSTEVWCAAAVEMYTEDVYLWNSLPEFFQDLKNLSGYITLYYHNLKFDGEFWLYYLLVDLGYQQALRTHVDGTKEWCIDSQMPERSIKYSISDMGQWYTITIKVNKDLIIYIKDSLKLLPFSVERIGQSFGTKHKKLDMEYKGERYAGCKITPEEQQYIKNDVLVVKEALEIMFRDGHNKLTIGACCLSEFKGTQIDYDNLYPNLYKNRAPFININESEGEWIYKSYKGGWCYCNPKFQNIPQYKGVTYDVNSLYPSMMHSISGNKYPVGIPHWWIGEIPKEALYQNRYYFVRIKTRFYLKEGFLPFIQIKRNALFNSHECLSSSKVYGIKTGEFIQDEPVELTLTCVDFELIKKHYDLKDLEIISGCWFYTEIGIFDEYIDKYMEIKKKSKGAEREEAKLFLNNLYGKMATKTKSDFKVAYQKETGELAYTIFENNDKKPGFIPIGSAITSYARRFTITAAQENIDHFCYADTDSIHCNCEPEEIKGIKEDSKEMCCWKKESVWDLGLFVRQKTYVEHIVADKSYYDIKCAGMPKKCKKLFLCSVEETEPCKYTFEEIEYCLEKRDITDFKSGLEVVGKLTPKRIKGGIILVDTTYKIKY